MGYESLLIVGRPTSIMDVDRPELRWVQVESTIELGKMAIDRRWSDLLDTAKPAPGAEGHCVYLPGDGTNLVYEDKYGAPLLALPWTPTLRALRALGKQAPRAKMALGYLEAFPLDWHPLILHYGH